MSIGYIEKYRRNMGAQAQMQLNRSKNKECNHHIKATIHLLAKKKRLSNDVCFVIEWSMMVMTENIMSKEVRTFANEMTKRVMMAFLCVCLCVCVRVNGVECHEYTVDDSFIPCDTINYHKKAVLFTPILFSYDTTISYVLIILQTCESFRTVWMV